MSGRGVRRTTKHEVREGVGRVRAARVKGKPGVTLHVIQPGVVDNFGSLWMPGTFDESLRRRLPTLCWAHNWSEPLGPGVGFRASSQGPDVDFQFSNFEAVPMALRAHAQVVDGTIRDCSVGFWNAQRRDPTNAEINKYPGIQEVIEKADLDEVSLVIRGAVPGAVVAGVRQQSRGRPLDNLERAAIAALDRVSARNSRDLPSSSGNRYGRIADQILANQRRKPRSR